MCATAFRVLSLVLDGEVQDPVLGDCAVDEVTVDGGGKLRVRIRVPDAARVAEARERLRRLEGWLRSAVAAALVRKRAPVLAFDVVPQSGVAP